MAAKTEDALEGYLLYLRKGGHISFREINNFLAKSGRREIALRTFDHYRRLYIHGFRYYVPINHLDVYLSLGGDRLTAERRRFHREEGGETLEYSFDTVIWHRAATTDVSSIGFGIVSSSVFDRKPLTPLFVRLKNHADVPGHLAWSKQQGPLTRFGVRADNYIHKYKNAEVVAITKPRPLGRVAVVRTGEGQLDWQKFTDVLNRTNQLIIAVENLIYTVAKRTGQEVILAKPYLESIEFHSPGEAPIKVDLGVAETIKLLIDNFGYLLLTRRKRIAETELVETAAKQAKVELIEKALSVSEKLNQHENQELANSLRQTLISTVGAQQVPKNFLEPETPERSLLENRIAPMASRLAELDDDEYKLSVDS
ncbi:MAG: hypothetical protein KF821_06415 [Anaerolineales bacterium]|nr:hypothetical protein [Anaerolineales bacterium]